MTKTFNHDALFFLGLSVVVGLFHCVLYFTVGTDLLTQHSFANFFLLANVISSFATAFILRPYYDQHFRVAFVTGLIAFLTALLRVVLV